VLRAAGPRAIAFVPGAPLLVEGLGGRGDVLATLRATCREAVAALGPGPVVVLGPGPEDRWYDESAPAVPAGWRPGFGGPGKQLPAALAVGRWLAAAADVVGAAAVADGRIPTVPAGAALLVVGDGSACRGPRAPLPDDPRGEPYDRAAAAALASGGPAVLGALDPVLGAAVGASGVAPWRVTAELAAPGPWRARLLAEEAPLGVAYLVATWLRDPDGET
jgi:hypothetical protein